MNLSRRSFGAMLGVAGISSAAGRIGATEVRTAAKLHNMMPENASIDKLAQDKQVPLNPLMSRSAALRLALKHPGLAEIFDEHVRSICTVNSIDPDIQVMKSFSPMAKITFQRQRNMVNARKQALRDLDHDHEDVRLPFFKIFDFIEKMVWGKH